MDGRTEAEIIEEFIMYRKSSRDNLAEFMTHYEQLWYDANRFGITNFIGMTHLISLLPQDWAAYAESILHEYVEFDDDGRLCGDCHGFITRLIGHFFANRDHPNPPQHVFVDPNTPDSSIVATPVAGQPLSPAGQPSPPVGQPPSPAGQPLSPIPQVVPLAPEIELEPQVHVHEPVVLGPRVPDPSADQGRYLTTNGHLDHVPHAPVPQIAGDEEEEDPEEYDPARVDY